MTTAGVADRNNSELRPGRRALKDARPSREETCEALGSSKLISRLHSLARSSSTTVKDSDKGMLPSMMCGESMSAEEVERTSAREAFGSCSDAGYSANEGEGKRGSFANSDIALVVSLSGDLGGT